MEEIININGTEYIKRERVKDIETELKNLKATMEQINKLTNGIPTDTITRHESPYKRTRVNNSDKDVFKVPPASQEDWEIRLMDDDGNFFSKNNRKLKVTIKEVFIVQKELSRSTTVKQARELRKRLELNEYTFNRLVYNLQQGNFAKFIKQWNQKTQPVVGKKQVSFENNPEKRKESGMYV